MADAVAGAILVELKAQVDQLQKGFRQASETLQRFGLESEKTGKRVTASATAMSDSFTAMEKKSIAATAKMTAFIGRLSAMQFALMATSGDKSGLGLLGRAFESASKGAAAAAAAMTAFQGKVSAMGAVALGVGVAGVDMFASKIRESIEATNAATSAQIRARLSMTELGDALKAASQASAVFGASGLQEAQKKLDIMQSQFDANLKRLREIPEQLAEIRQALDSELGKPWGLRSDTKAGMLRSQLESLELERGSRERTNADITRIAAAARASAVLQQIGADAAAASKALSDVREVGARSLELGISTPAEVATARLAAAQARLQAIIQQELKLRDAAAMPGLSDEKRAEILNQIRSLSSDVGQARGEFFDARGVLESQRRFETVVNGFSSSFASAVERGILSGQKPMAILAGVGENLFADAIGNAMKAAQTGLSDALKAISGGSDIAAGAITGALGIAGGIFAARAGKGSDQFSAVKNVVENSQAVRGIVAGPSSVAISTLNEKMSEAMEPTRMVLLQMLVELKSINRKTGAGNGSIGFGSSVPTT